MEDFDHLVKIRGMDKLFKRVHNPEEVKSQITGFFDEFIALIDRDGNGEICTKEFRPIWEMMCEANLTTAQLKDVDEKWHEFKQLVLQNGPEHETLIEKAIDLFKNSHWDDPIKFDLLSAGKKFFNLMWDHRQVGSLVTTKGDPLQVYLKVDIEDLGQDLLSKPDLFQDVRNMGHFGTGDTRLRMKELITQPDRVKIMNHLLNSVSR